MWSSCIIRSRAGTTLPSHFELLRLLKIALVSVPVSLHFAAIRKQKIANTELQIRNKNDNKEVALGTSKINYMDPRITVAWCKRNEVPIEK